MSRLPLAPLRAFVRQRSLPAARCASRQLVPAPVILAQPEVHPRVVGNTLKQGGEADPAGEAPPCPSPDAGVRGEVAGEEELEGKGRSGVLDGIVVRRSVAGVVRRPTEERLVVLVVQLGCCGVEAVDVEVVEGDGFAQGPDAKRNRSTRLVEGDLVQVEVCATQSASRRRPGEDNAQILLRTPDEKKRFFASSAQRPYLARNCSRLGRDRGV
jgi:hypothetical protein